MALHPRNQRAEKDKKLIIKYMEMLFVETFGLCDNSLFNVYLLPFRNVTAIWENLSKIIICHFF